MSAAAPALCERRRAGFTLVEVLVSLGVLAFGLLTLALMQLQALTQGSRGRHTTDAASVARSALEQVHRVPWTVLSTTQGLGGWQNPNWTSAQATVANQVDVPDGGGTATEQSYAVDWRVTDVGAAPTCLRDVEVRVRWTDEGASEKSLVFATRRYNWGNAGC